MQGVGTLAAACRITSELAAIFYDIMHLIIRELLEELEDEVIDDKELWNVSNELLKMILRTRNPSVWETFTWCYDSKYIAWQVREYIYIMAKLLILFISFFK